MELGQNPAADDAQAAAQAEVARDAYARFGEEVSGIVEAIHDAGVPAVDGGEQFRDHLTEASRPPGTSWKTPPVAR